jgi:aurora kinase
MAPTKPTAQAAPTATKSTEKGSIIGSLKTSVCIHYRANTSICTNTTRQIISTNLSLSIFRKSEQTKVTKPALKSKTVAEREHFKRVAQRLSAIEGSPRSSSSPQQALSSSDGHTLLQSPSTLTALDFEIGGTLGKGKFGRVYLARHLATNYICALKIISKAQCTNEEEERLIRRELEVHQNLTHENILKLLSWFHDNVSIYLVLEYAPGGSLYSRLKKQPKARCAIHCTDG